MALLDYADFDGRDALLVQAESARADWLCGCNGENIGGLTAFADEGYLSSLEVHWYLEPISPFPPLDRLRLYRLER